MIVNMGEAWTRPVVVSYPRFRIWVFPDAHLGIECRTCHTLSHNANDAIERYCGYCHAYHDDPLVRESAHP
jgi:hypothetical protein